jgi:hypothetical protein
MEFTSVSISIIEASEKDIRDIFDSLYELQRPLPRNKKVEIFKKDQRLFRRSRKENFPCETKFTFFFKKII